METRGRVELCYASLEFHTKPATTFTPQSQWSPRMGGGGGKTSYPFPATSDDRRRSDADNINLISVPPRRPKGRPISESSGEDIQLPIRKNKKEAKKPILPNVKAVPAKMEKAEGRHFEKHQGRQAHADKHKADRNVVKHRTNNIDKNKQAKKGVPLPELPPRPNPVAVPKPTGKDDPAVASSSTTTPNEQRQTMGSSANNQATGIGTRQSSTKHMWFLVALAGVMSMATVVDFVFWIKFVTRDRTCPGSIKDSSDLQPKPIALWQTGANICQTHPHDIDKDKVLFSSEGGHCVWLSEDQPLTVKPGSLGRVCSLDFYLHAKSFHDSDSNIEVSTGIDGFSCQQELTPTNSDKVAGQNGQWKKDYNCDGRETNTLIFRVMTSGKIKLCDLNLRGFVRK